MILIVVIETSWLCILKVILLFLQNLIMWILALIMTKSLSKRWIYGIILIWIHMLIWISLRRVVSTKFIIFLLIWHWLIYRIFTKFISCWTWRRTIFVKFVWLSTFLILILIVIIVIFHWIIFSCIIFLKLLILNWVVRLFLCKTIYIIYVLICCLFCWRSFLYIIVFICKWTLIGIIWFLESCLNIWIWSSLLF